MTTLQASRTLVKSAPELWAECSDAASLAKHLGTFGEIRITKLEPETAVAWEGDAARGTVRLEPSGWGTRVVLTAAPTVQQDSGVPPAPPQDAPPALALALADPDPDPDPELRGRWRRLFLLRPRRSGALTPAVGSPPVSSRGPSPSQAAAADAGSPVASALDEALDSLGRAHHRPYSRG